MAPTALPYPHPHSPGDWYLCTCFFSLSLPPAPPFPPHTQRCRQAPPSRRSHDQPPNLQPGSPRQPLFRLPRRPRYFLLLLLLLLLLLILPLHTISLEELTRSRLPRAPLSPPLTLPHAAAIGPHPPAWQPRGQTISLQELNHFGPEDRIAVMDMVCGLAYPRLPVSPSLPSPRLSLLSLSLFAFGVDGGRWFGECG